MSIAAAAQPWHDKAHRDHDEGGGVDLQDTKEETKAIACRAIEIVASGTREDFDEVIHPEYFNHEAGVWREPGRAQGRGPEAAWSTAQWLRSTFADINHDIRTVVADGEIVAMHCVTSMRQVGDLALHDDEGGITEVLAPSGKSATTTQTHWVRIVDGKCVEHWANRDDLSAAEQLGWLQAGARNPLRPSRSRGMS